MCAIVFVAFSLAWLYFQADMLRMAQHVLSGGITHYHSVIGSVVITCVLYLLQLLVYRITLLNGRMHALTYLPSMLLLALLSDISMIIADVSPTMSLWWSVLILIIWLVVVYIARNVQQDIVDRTFSLL